MCSEVARGCCVKELAGIHWVLCKEFRGGGGKNSMMQQQLQITKRNSGPGAASIKVMSEMAQKSSTYSSKMSTDIPLYESPGASFDLYLEDKPRVFQAIFPDKRRSEQLSQTIYLKYGTLALFLTCVLRQSQQMVLKARVEEWRIQMLPIQFLFLTVRPVVDMRLRCKTRGEDYPAGIPSDISKVLELVITRWELQGLDNAVMPSHFSLGVKGALYPDRHGVRTRLKGQLEMKITVVLPPALTLVPDDVLRSVSEAVLRRLVENMKDKVNSSLLEDYSQFRRERLRNFVA